MVKKISNTNTIYPESDALKKINYDENAHILEATFSNNKTYQYLKVSKTTWKNFLEVIYSGKSAGTFINKEIKPHHKYRLLK